MRIGLYVPSVDLWADMGGTCDSMNQNRSNLAFIGVVVLELSIWLEIESNIVFVMKNNELRWEVSLVTKATQPKQKLLLGEVRIEHIVKRGRPQAASACRASPSGEQVFCATCQNRQG